MFHRDVQPGDIHVPYNFVVADDTERLALVAGDFTSNDVGKLIGQQSDLSLWIITALSPSLMLRFIGGGFRSAQASEGLSTTSTVGTWTDKVSVTVPADHEGAFDLAYSAEMGGASGSRVGVRVIQDGVTVIAECEYAIGHNNDALPFAGHIEGSLVGASTIDIEYRLVSGSTAGIRRARLSVKRIG